MYAFCSFHRVKLVEGVPKIKHAQFQGKKALHTISMLGKHDRGNCIKSNPTIFRAEKIHGDIQIRLK